jgi:pyruvate,water dikinase
MKEIFSKKQACIPLTSIQGPAAKKYRFFKSYLNYNQAALKAVAELEQLYYSGKPFTLTFVRRKYEDLLEAVHGAIYTLEAVSGKKYPALHITLQGIDAVISDDIKPGYTYITEDLVLPFGQIYPELKRMVGSKAANLAFVKNELGLPVPEGFAITAYAFERFIEENSLSKPIERELSKISTDSLENLEKISEGLQKMIMDAEVPQYISDAILRAYGDIEEKTHKDLRIAMRSSAVGEDTEATFAGQYTTLLNVTKENIIDAYKTIIASKYSARAVAYRLNYGLTDRETPMCVIGIAMVDSKSSGVVYTGDSLSGDTNVIKINSIWGLGEHLVDGSASADNFLIDRKTMAIIKREISRKEYRLVNSASGGTRLENVPENEKEMPSINDTAVSRLAHYSIMLEEVFGGLQDIEWAADENNNLFILQSRPLSLTETIADKDITQQVFLDNPVLLQAGQTASPGIAAGSVFIAVEGADVITVPENAIFVAKTASPNYAKLMGKIAGIITDIGSATSHLASVSREFGIPFIADAKTATVTLKEGDIVTMSASTATVYKGLVEELINNTRPAKKLVFESPIHRRIRRILDRISPLNLTDPAHPSFSPEGCKTVHDIIRFSHENVMKGMFGLADNAEKTYSIKLTAVIPLILHIIDLGGGLRAGLTTCDTVTPDDIESMPMKAIWKGFTHPGITGEGTINLDVKNILTLFASSAISEFGEMPGGVSYAVVSNEYMNLSAKFGYHFATIDTLCSENSNQNYLSLQFAGGAGNYYGKTLRVYFLGSILGRLGCDVSMKGDLLEAFISGYDRPSLEDKLDQIGRLLACSRLLDMAISSQNDAELLADAFFNEEYDFLSKRRDDELRDFYTHGGYWKRTIENHHAYCVQDGLKAGYFISSGAAGIAGKFIGQKVQEFLDNIEAFYYFPLAIAKNSEISDGKVSVRVKPIKGHIDRAGGIAFGLRNSANYFALRINALEDNIILFEYINGKRIQRVNKKRKIESDKWYELMVNIKNSNIKGYLDKELVVEYEAEKPLKGFIGLWTKADSVTYFDELRIQSNGKERLINF